MILFLINCKICKICCPFFILRDLFWKLMWILFWRTYPNSIFDLIFRIDQQFFIRATNQKNIFALTSFFSSFVFIFDPVKNWIRFASLLVWLKKYQIREMTCVKCPFALNHDLCHAISQILMYEKPYFAHFYWFFDQEIVWRHFLKL